MLVLVLPLLHLRNNGVPRSQILRLDLNQQENRFYEQESHSRTIDDEYEKPFDVFTFAVVLLLLRESTRKTIVSHEKMWNCSLLETDQS